MKFFTPTVVAVLALLVGAGLAVMGVYLLAGPGWALIASAVPMLLLSIIIFRGMQRAQQIPG